MDKKEQFLEKIHGMREDNFSQDIVIPLLEKMGYTFTDFHGGPYELGKDIIARKEGDFGEQEVAVVQSKKFRSKRSQAVSQEFGQIVHQLRLCLEKKIPCSDGIERYPETVIFITPFSIDTRILAEQFETVRLIGIKIIDQTRLLFLLDKYWPSVFDEFDDDIDAATRLLKEDVRNVELDRALHIEERGSYADYYSDLNFFVGAVESSKVFSGCIKIERSYDGGYEREDWLALKRADSWIRRAVGTSLLSQESAKVEAVYEVGLGKYISLGNQELIRRRDDLKLSLVTLNQQLSKMFSDLLSGLVIKVEKEKSKKNAARVAELSRLEEELRLATAVGRDARGLADIVKLLTSLNRLASVDRDDRQQLSNIVDACVEMVSLAGELDSVSSVIEPAPLYIAEVLEKRAEDLLNEKIKLISGSIVDLNEGKLSLSEVRGLLDEVNNLLRCLDNLLRNDCRVIKVDLIKSEGFKKVLNVSAHAIFDAGCNVALFGEAGAGKSTTLYVYAERLYKSKKDEELVLFVPLNRVVSKLNALSSDDRTSLIDACSPFDAFVNAFLLFKGVAPSPANRNCLVDRLRSSKRAVVILDALDEAAGHAKWIIPALSELSLKINGLQVIASSRNCASYIRDIEFLGITLLPFTREQLLKFIRGWIGDSEKADSLWASISQREIFEVAKNPLLATIICTLHDSGIPVPENEPDVYRKKIELLCGLYDQHKGVRRTTNEKSVLEFCCRKIAFQMHFREKREATLNEIKGYLYASSEGRYPRPILESALEDLIFHCNILIHSTDNDLYSFGHLRIQEFLASEELARNRGVDLVGLAAKAWWIGALYLYSFSCDIEPLMEDMIRRHGSLRRYQDTLITLISAQPIRRRQALMSLIGGHGRIDSLEGYEDDFSYSDENDLEFIRDLTGFDRR